jgi:hypothetical protein
MTTSDRWFINMWGTIIISALANDSEVKWTALGAAAIAGIVFLVLKGEEKRCH